MGDHVYLAYDYPVLGAFWTAMWVFLWVLWIFLLFRVVLDIFRDDSMSGGAKTGWLVFVVLLPFLGVFVYVVARGTGMGRREQRHAESQQKAFDDYIRKTAGASDGGGHADQLARLAQLRADGTLSEEEFQKAKERVLS
ncbi:SHOCT domain-containing protein [Actinacidiphila acidipaludis]|uniref:SHOCT domain-containing protein n=1 Tax=Actinacidiphila acidipaludis TaxID=2873382 RepID=A0ABS7Q7B5_9ACTN|nr:SHOCT domain-containing protein [Streptomyces acidipaludis]MBY8879038.1 SHOCT domain-containing protein [Streptomyces acidipaludis]